MITLDNVTSKKTQNSHHILILEDAETRKTIYLDGERYTLGRHSSNSIVILSRKVSRFHATLLRRKDLQNQQESYWILDGDLAGNKSHNGLFVNQKRCLVHQLENGDTVSFGTDIKATYHIISESKSSPSNELSSFISPESIKSQEAKIKTLVDPNLDQLDSGILALKDKKQDIEDKTPVYKHDLTNLGSPILLKENLNKALANAKRNPTQVGILMIEIEDFHLITHDWGNFVGEQLLKKVGERLVSCLREGDTIAYESEALFTVLIPAINNQNHIINLLQRLYKVLKTELKVEQKTLSIEPAIGVALYPQDAPDAETLLRRAKVALCRTKHKGENAYGFYNSAMNSKLSGIEKLEKLLQQALVKNQLFLYYQPLVNIATGKIEGLEALLRWHHPSIGLIMPGQFLPLAEDSNIITVLNEWVLNATCVQIKQWQRQGFSPLPVAVNLSSRQFYQANLVTMVKKVLAKNELKAEWLELEISEKTFMENPIRASQILYQLHQLGVRLCLDDFGLGKTSLNDLRNLPIQTLKIAQSLVSQLTTNPEDIALISAAIAWGHSFNFHVVIEGVETQNQFECLRHLPCEKMQGYRFSRPLNPHETTTYLSQHGLY